MDTFRTPRGTRPAGLVRPVRLDPTGESGPTRSAARHGRWRRTAPGWFVPAEVDSSVPEQRILEQAVRIRDPAALSGWASLRWQGAAYLDGWSGHQRLPVLAVTTSMTNLRPGPDLAVSREQLAPREVAVVDGVRCTVPERAVFDEVRRAAGWRTAVVVVDMTTAAGLASLDGLRADLALRTGCTGVDRARTAYGRAVEGAWSPAEVRVRLHWEVDAGLAPLLCNRPVFGRGGELLGIPDLIEPRSGVVIEYDGADHRERDRRRADLAKWGRFRDHELEVAVVVTGDLRDAGLVVDRLLAAHRRARHLAPANRPWTLDQPQWWTRRQQPPEAG